MSMTVFNPFRELERFEKAFNDDFGFYKPATDLYETDKEFIVKVDLPGFTKEDISVSSSNNVVEIKAELVKEEETSKDSEKDEQEKSNNDWVPRHVERISRNYYRKIKFHKPIDAKNATLNLENGVLTMKLPISKEAQKISLTID